MGTLGFEPKSDGVALGNHRQCLIAPRLEPSILAKLYYVPTVVFRGGGHYINILIFLFC